MDPLKIIEKYYPKDSITYPILVRHSQAVTKKALEIADRVPQLHPDKKFIAEAAMLHDVGIFLTSAPDIGCLGDKPYICHGVLGREILEKEGYPKHALVCERHIGVGLALKEDIERQNLPLPHREMVPISTEEEIICLADKFSSKRPQVQLQEESIDQIRAELTQYGEHKVKKLNELLKKYGF